MLKIVAFSGAQASGKDTFANALHEYAKKQHVNTTNVSFAKAVKDQSSDLIKANLDPTIDIYDYIKSHYDITDDEINHIINILNQINTPDITIRTKPVRELLQTWGTDIWRKRNANHWVNITVKTINDIYETQPDTIILVTDARFPNELEALHHLNAFLVALDIPEEIRIERIKNRDGFEPTKESLNHQSEHAWKEFDKGFHLTVKQPDSPITKPEILVQEIFQKVMNGNVNI